MSKKKIVVLNGAGNEDDYLANLFSLLKNILDHENDDVKYYHLKDIPLAHCDGCYGCWIETPGICVKTDEQSEIIQNIIRSDITILFTPVTFGGYSSTLKIIVDRFIPLVLPFFGKYYGDIHHTPRYSVYPRIVGIGVQSHFAKEEAEVFKALVGRNATNFHAPTFAADVFGCEEDKEVLNIRLRNVITRSDPFPLKEDVVNLTTKADIASFDNNQEGVQNALLIVGSPKIGKSSTSGVLGEYLIEILNSKGWKTEVLKLKGSLRKEKAQVELCSAVERSDLIILAFPLYIDALPFLVTKALEVIARHRKNLHVNKHQKIFTVINNGFPEFHQNALALAICRFFADQCGISWAGALALGAGQAIVDGQKLTSSERKGPPVKHIMESLEKAGADLAKGNIISPNIQSQISKNPIPVVPYWVWGWMFKKFGGQMWERRALQNKVEKEEMYAKPYTD
jgi:multimeric flavodoxin WrbA